MKFLLAALMLVSMNASAPPTASLVGEWRSDRIRTMNYLRQHVKLEKRTDHFLEQMMGRLTITFSTDRVKSVMPAYDATINGKSHHMTGFESDNTYRVLYSGPRVVVVSSLQPVTNTLAVTTYNFDGPDVIWIYTGGADQVLPDSHYREYFRRVH